MTLSRDKVHRDEDDAVVIPKRLVPVLITLVENQLIELKSKKVASSLLKEMYPHFYKVMVEGAEEIIAGAPLNEEEN